MSILAKGIRIRNLSYLLPDVLRSLEEYQKFRNLDIPEMDVFSLQQELFKVKAALAYLDPQRQPWLFVEPGKYISAADWLKARYLAIKGEFERREIASA